MRLMEISWHTYKQIILNDRPIWYKPTKDVVVRLGKLFPDLNIFGFGRYPETNYWYVLACSDSFPENTIGGKIVTPIADVYSWAKPTLIKPVPSVTI